MCVCRMHLTYLNLRFVGKEKMWQRMLGLGSYIYSLFIMTQYLIFVGNYSIFIPFIPTLGDLDGSTNRDSLNSPSFILWNVILLCIFFIQHWGMARPAFKEFISVLYPPNVERALYILLSSLTLQLLLTFWIPLPLVLIQFPMFMKWIPLVGFTIVLLATFEIDHFDMFGLKQSLYSSNRDSVHSNQAKVENLYRSGLYAFIRHPMMTGMFIAFWFSSELTVGRALFAFLNSIFILITVLYFEEPNLVSVFGQEYLNYQQSTPAFIPFSLLWFSKATIIKDLSKSKKPKRMKQ